jgi:transposase-like protein
MSAPTERCRSDGPQEERRRLSNPVQHRLSPADIEQLIHMYRAGGSIKALARRYDVHRTTVMSQLARSGINARRNVRKLTDESVTLAATQYAAGASLAAVASAFGVHERTLAREFRRAGVATRLRRGWRP